LRRSRIRIRKELHSGAAAKFGESIILDRLKRAKQKEIVLGTPIRLISPVKSVVVIYGFTDKRSGAPTRKDCESAAELALRSWPAAPKAKGRI